MICPVAHLHCAVVLCVHHKERVIFPTVLSQLNSAVMEKS